MDKYKDLVLELISDKEYTILVIIEEVEDKKSLYEVAYMNSADDHIHETPREDAHECLESEFFPSLLEAHAAAFDIIKTEIEENSPLDLKVKIIDVD